MYEEALDVNQSIFPLILHIDIYSHGKTSFSLSLSISISISFNIHYVLRTMVHSTSCVEMKKKYIYIAIDFYNDVKVLSSNAI